jgi:hypothetical protein
VGNHHARLFKFKCLKDQSVKILSLRVTNYSIFAQYSKLKKLLLPFLHMKYKRLTTGELKELQPEFVHFLAAAQITGPDWDAMKKNELSKAEELIEVFSDMVYEKVMSKIKFLEYRERKTLNIFHCMEDNIVLVGLRVHEHSHLDLTADDVFSQWTESNATAVNVIKTERPYQKERGVEVFELLQSGCFITDDKLFNLLKGMIN